VLDEHATAVAALSVSAPVQRIRAGDPAALGALLAAQAVAVSCRLAGVPRHISQLRV
jgi:DNA-binding IclR family transcriptional regulator